MKFCSQCGAPVKLRVPPGDNLPRYVCEHCGIIHYQNPKIVAGCIPDWENKILLCRRAIEPRYGLWTLPAGFMENSETTSEAAAREAMEEANAEICNLTLYALFNLPHINQVYLIYRGQLNNGLASAGEESLEVKLFTENEIPWNELAFPVINETLKLYYKDRRNGHYNVHVGDIIRESDRTLTVNHY